MSAGLCYGSCVCTYTLEVVQCTRLLCILCRWCNVHGSSVCACILWMFTVNSSCRARMLWKWRNVHDRSRVHCATIMVLCTRLLYPVFWVLHTEQGIVSMSECNMYLLYILSMVCGAYRISASSEAILFCIIAINAFVCQRSALVSMTGRAELSFWFDWKEPGQKMAY